MQKPNQRFSELMCKHGDEIRAIIEILNELHEENEKWRSEVEKKIDNMLGVLTRVVSREEKNLSGYVTETPECKHEWSKPTTNVGYQFCMNKGCTFARYAPEFEKPSPSDERNIGIENEIASLLLNNCFGYSLSTDIAIILTKAGYRKTPSTPKVKVHIPSEDEMLEVLGVHHSWKSTVHILRDYLVKNVRIEKEGE